MIEIDITPEIIHNAEKEARELGVLKDSITKGGGNIYGFIGEHIVAKYFSCRRSNTYDYDMISSRNNKIDVKTKHCTSKPRMHYECSVPAFNTKQRCDYYVFVRVLKDLKKAWILGWMGKEDYYNKATLFREGDFDSSNNFKFHCDSYNLKISELICNVKKQETNKKLAH